MGKIKTNLQTYWINSSILSPIKNIKQWKIKIGLIFEKIE